MDVAAKINNAFEVSDLGSNTITPPVKTNLSRLPIILIILGMVETVYFLAQVVNAFVIVPQMMALYSEFNAETPTNPYKGVYLLSVLTLISIAEIVYGFWLRKVQKARGILPLVHKRIAQSMVIATVFLFFLSFVFLIFSIIAPIYNLKSTFKEVACTQEAKQCSDGSYVSRTGPNCEFAPCPTPTADLSRDEVLRDWKTYRNEQMGIEFKYPSDFTYKGDCSNRGHIGFDRVDLINDGSVYCAEIGFPEGSYAIYLSIVSDSKNVEEAIRNIPLGPSHRLSPQTKLIVNNNEFTKVQRIFNNGTYDGFYFIKYPKNSLILRFYLVHPKRTTKSNITINYEDILDQILSTFKFLDQNQTINSKSCMQDADCTLRACTGCFNKEWLKTAPADLPCMVYADYSCQCTGNKCLEIK